MGDSAVEKPDYVPDGVEVTTENAHEFIPYWVRKAPPKDAPHKGRGRGLDLHYPDPECDRENPEPLCETANQNDNWEAKDVAVYPGGWGSHCGKCLAFANGMDYRKSSAGATSAD